MRENYIEQAELLLDVLPLVMKDNRLALKGGTAINFFYREAPRLSVDIDICYLPIEDRKTSFHNIHKILKEIKFSLERLNFKVKSSHPLDTQKEVRLFIKNRSAEIKVEPNFIIRGSVFSPEIKTTSKYIMDTFHKQVEIKCLNFSDIFAGKIVATLSRQHPRDLFDIKYLLEKEGITKQIRKAFLVYLISSPRPIHEILMPNLKEISQTTFQDFQGMVNTKVTQKDLINTREALINAIKNNLTDDEKHFLIGFKKLSPDWSLLDLEQAKNLPSVQWKILNLKKMSEEKRNLQCKLLEEKLFK